MRRHIAHFILSAIICFSWDSLTSWLLVYPKEILSLWAFWPPLLGLAWGPAGIAGSALGGFVTGLAGEHGLADALLFFWLAFLGALLPYKLWHLSPPPPDEAVFPFYRKTLWKFLAIIFAACAITSSTFPLLLSDSQWSALSASGWNLAAWEWIALRFLNDFTVAVFFGMPFFFILVCYGYPFYLPPGRREYPLPKNYDLNPLSLVFLYAFFLGIFLLLDVSGIIFDLDELDTWLQFIGEILAVMDATIFSLLYLLMKYRKSIMTHLIIMELTTIFFTALLLGSIGFAGMNSAIEARVKNDLEKMSVIYRERLTHTFRETITATRSMAEIAMDGHVDKAQLQSDAAYRRDYLATMEREFRPIAENSRGCVSFYLALSKEFGGGDFLWTRQPERWGTKLPPFAPSDLNRYRDRYHLLHERYLATLSEPYQSPATGKYMISYVVPLREADRFVGLVGLDIDFGYIIHEIQRMSVYEHSLVCLLDKHGNILYASQEDSGEYLKQRGLHTAESYLSNGVWLKIAAFSHDIYADRNNMLLHFIAVMFCVVIVISFLNVKLVKRGIRPLMLITEAARKIAAGDLAVRLPKETQNELGTLVKSIREMVGKLEIYVYRDKLTGLRNVAAYARKHEELEEACRKGETTEYAVVLFDVNFLKRTNDTYGHEAGNELIRRASASICRTFAHSPVFRIGGDEFVAILEHSDYERREELLLEFDAEIARQAFDWKGVTVPVSVARGLGLYSPGTEYATVFHAADEGMYQHKASLKAGRET